MIKFVPRPGKFYAVGATNLGERPDNEKATQFERKNRIMAVLGQDWGPFTGYAGVIRSRGGGGINFRPFWFNKNLNRRFELKLEASDFDREKVVQNRLLDEPWMAVGASFALTRWLWIGARFEDILERSDFMANFNIIFRDEDFSYLFGWASVSK